MGKGGIRRYRVIQIHEEVSENHEATITAHT